MRSELGFATAWQVIGPMNVTAAKARLRDLVPDQVKQEYHEVYILPSS